MKQVTLRCSCGASVELTDDAESLIDPVRGHVDGCGRRFLIEVRADEWLTRHQACTDTKNELARQTIKKATKRQE